MNLSVLEEHQITQFHNTLQNLLALDQLWTRRLPAPGAEHASHFPKLGTEDRQGMVTIGDHVDRTWVELEGQLPAVEAVLARHAGDLEAALTTGLGQLPLPPSDIEQVTAFARRHGGLGPAVRRSIDELRHIVPAERRTLQDKVSLLKSNAIATGDMSHRAECGIIFLGAMLLILTAQAPLAAAGVGGFIARGCVNQ